MMRDREPEKEAEFLEMEVMKVVDTEAAPVVGAGAGAGAGEGIAGEDLMEGPIADPPAPFEWTEWE